MKSPVPREVWTLLVETGRAPEDGLPKGATGAAFLCYCPARSEEEAVRETVALFRQAGLAPLDVTGYGSRADRAGEIEPEEAALMARALAEESVVVAEKTVLGG